MIYNRTSNGSGLVYVYNCMNSQKRFPLGSFPKNINSKPNTNDRSILYLVYSNKGGPIFRREPVYPALKFSVPREN